MHRRAISCGPRVLLTIAFAAMRSLAAGSVAIAADVKVQTVLSGLHAPCGVAIRPDSAGAPFEVFVADRGAGRVVQISSATPDTGTDAISGFAAGDAHTNASIAAVGIAAILFLDHTRLVVTGGDENGKPFLWLYELSDSDPALKVEDHKQEIELARIVNDSTMSLLNIHAVARTQPNDRVADMLVLAASGKRELAGLWKVVVRANTLGNSGRFAAAEDRNKLDSIGGIAIGSGGYIVVACDKLSDSVKSCTLRYLSPIDGHVVLEIGTKLRRIAALAYGPSGNLYAANLAASDQGGGVYRIDDASDPGKPACNAVKIAELPRPTALAFGPDGALFVTVLGDIGGDSDSGALLRFTGDL